MATSNDAWGDSHGVDVQMLPDDRDSSRVSSSARSDPLVGYNRQRILRSARDTSQQERKIESERRKPQRRLDGELQQHSPD